MDGATVTARNRFVPRPGTNRALAAREESRRGAPGMELQPMEPRITFATSAGERSISLEHAFELVERLRTLELNIGAAAVVVIAIREHASAGGDVSPITLSPG